MDSDFSSLITLVLDTQSLGNQAEAIGRFLPDRLPALASHAGHLIHRSHVADPAFDADDAVQDALLQLWKATRGGKIGPIETAEELLKLLAHKLRHEVLNERVREETLKRGGASVSRIDADFEAIDPHCTSPGEKALAEDGFESWMKRLYERDPLLPAIAAMKTDGFSHQEIATQLGVGLSTVERRVRLVKVILAAGHAESE